MSSPPPTESLELAGGEAKARIAPSDGGRLVSLEVAGNELLYAASPDRPGPAGILRGCFVMAPFVGRLADGKFRFDGSEYQLPCVHEGHAIHGLLYDRPWTPVSGTVLSAEFDERWPFGGQAYQRFDLKPDSLSVTLHVVNEKRSMPVTVGFHPWFRRVISGHEAELVFQPLHRYECDPSGIPIEMTTCLGERPWDDSFDGVLAAPRIRWGDIIELSIVSRTRRWIVCETDSRAICVEPLTGPVNSLNSGAYALVGPGRPLTHTMTLRWVLGRDMR